MTHQEVIAAEENFVRVSCVSPHMLQGVDERGPASLCMDGLGHVRGERQGQVNGTIEKDSCRDMKRILHFVSVIIFL